MKHSIKNLIVLLIYIFGIISITSCSDNQATDPEVKDRASLWREDIDYFSSQMKLKHINLFSLISEQKFNSDINNIKNSVNSLQDYEIYLQLQRMLSSLHVAHTSIVPSSSTIYHFLPIIPYVFSDGLYVIMTDELNTNLLGKKILKVGNKDVGTVLDSLKTLISYENSYWLKDRIPYAFYLVEALKYFGFTSSLAEVEVEVEGVGKIILRSAELNATSNPSGFRSVLENKPMPLYMQNQLNFYWYSFIDSKKTLYIKYNACSNMPNKSFAGFVNEIKNSLPNHNVEKYVIDVRDNGGGNSSVISPIFNLLDGITNISGKLFVITGRHTMSSSLLNAITLKQRYNCTLVGEATGGKPNSYGEVLTFALPNSGMTVQYSTKYFIMVTGDPESLSPDYNVEITSQDYINGRDPVLEFIYYY